MNLNQNEIVERVKAPTPNFFKKLRNIALAAGAIGGVIVAAPITLPPLVITIGGYLVTAGLVAGAVSSVVKEDTPTK